MKIRKRISLYYTSFLGIVLFIGFIVLYFSVSSDQHHIFKEKLSKRVNAIESIILNNYAADKLKTAEDHHALYNEKSQIVPFKNFHKEIKSELKAHIPEDLLAALKKQNTTVWDIKEYQGMAKQVTSSSGKFVIIVIAEDYYGDKMLRDLIFILIGLFALTIGIGFLLSLYLSKRILTPISNKIQQANLISAENLSTRLAIYDEKDELGMLAKSFNLLLDRLEEAFETEKNFVRYASHELKNPLTVILGEAEVTLLKNRTPNEYIESIEKIEAKALRMNTLITQFLKLSKLEKDKLIKKRVNLLELIYNIIDNVNANTEQPVEITLNHYLKTEGIVMADQSLLFSALFNLVENACKFSPVNGRVEIGLKENSKAYLITVTDNGIGITADEMHKVFDPLYRGNNTAQVSGTGIGLSLTKKILELHGGNVQVESTPNKSTTFTVKLLK